MPRLVIAIATMLVIIAIGSLMSNRAEAMVGTPVGTRNAVESTNMVELVQYAPEPRPETEFGRRRTSRVHRPRPEPRSQLGCNWVPNLTTGGTAGTWVCRTKENYDVAPRHPRIVPRYR